ncbi:hypothetical protein [Celeribacter sp.]|uniref:AbiU2 domain-containing protein n=1 Tax=Celeribacter sp. TaxID=1890673 RepID=UPI003A940DB6
MGRVAIRRLDTTTDTLVLFCTKTIEDTQHSHNVKQLKNFLLDGLNPVESAETKTKIHNAFRKFNTDSRPYSKTIKEFRDEVAAHSDKNFIQGERDEYAPIRDLITFAEMIVNLIELLTDNAIIEALDYSVISDKTLTLLPYSSLHEDALAFWRNNFLEWAK